MRIQPLAIVVLWVVSSCAGSQAAPADAGAAAPAADAASYEVHGLKVDRPTDWEFIPPDASVVSDTVMILHGPLGESDMRPAVEISRRELSAADRKRKPAHILTTLALEIVQTFAAFDADGEPEDVQISGLSGAMMRMMLTEMLPDGASAERVARFYLVVQGSEMWVIRCFGPADGSAGEAFDAIVGSIEISE